MKIVKYLFLLILLAAIAVTVFIATQEGRYDIKKERVIGVPKTVLYNYINDYRNWEHVGVLTGNDTTAVFTYSDNTSGLGAVSNWKLGTAQGRVQTTKVIENDSIIQKAIIDKQPSDISWGFSEAKGGTRVSVRLKGNLTFQDKAYAILNGGVQEKLESVLDQGLVNLNKFLVHELSTYDVEVKGLVGKTGVFYLKQTSKATMGDMNKKASVMLARLTAFTKTNNIATNGAPFTLLKSLGSNNDTISFSVCVPIKEEIFTTPGSEFEGGKLEPFTALKTTLKGDYSH
ncbi:MAG: transcriptional regulator, partial [Flavobacterium sp.]